MRRSGFFAAASLLFCCVLACWLSLISQSNNVYVSTSLKQQGVTFQQQVGFQQRATTKNTHNTTHSVSSSPSPSPPHQQRPTARFAYAFVIGGCNPQDPAYLGFLYNVWIAARLLRRVQTRADVVLYVQMSSQQSTWQTLPSPQQAILHDLGIRTLYIPPNPYESFYEIVLDKFRVLNLTEYDRVLLLDADVMPLGNLDYLFELSVQGDLMENYVVTTEREPANGGFFMVTPHVGDWERISDIVRQRELAAAAAAAATATSAHNNDNNNLQVTMFDPVRGWGHAIVPPDYWETKRERGTNWTFNFAYSDQGLLYHWVKYVQKDVSIRRSGQIQHWTTTPNGTLVLDHITRRQLERYANPLVVDRYYCVRWGCDWAHFTSDKKPWLQPPPANFLANPGGHKSTNALELWFTTLEELNRHYHLNINFTDWSIGRPTLGTWAGYGQVRAKAQRTIESSESFLLSKRAKMAHAVVTFNKSTAERLPRCAYAFVLSNYTPNDFTQQGFLYNVMVSTRILQLVDSRAAVVVLIRMSKKTSQQSLVPKDQAVLQALGVRIIYISNNKSKDSFMNESRWDKFRILNLTDYERVVFMDLDVMPLGNTDYLFELSINGIIQENLILTGENSPAAGSFFMVTPHVGDWEWLRKVVAQRNRVEFDEIKGWGHAILAPDYWETKTQRGTNWSFPLANSDEGLLYHWVKYVRENVSIRLGAQTQNWMAAPNGTFHVVNTTTNLLGRFSNPVLLDKESCQQYMCDFKRFSVESRPWSAGPPRNLDSLGSPATSSELWFKTLQRLNDEYSLNIDFSNWTREKARL